MGLRQGRSPLGFADHARALERFEAELLNASAPAAAVMITLCVLGHLCPRLPYMGLIWKESSDRKRAGRGRGIVEALGIWAQSRVSSAVWADQAQLHWIVICPTAIGRSC